MGCRPVLVLIAILALAGCGRSEIDPHSGEIRRSSAGRVVTEVVFGFLELGLRAACH